VNIFSGDRLSGDRLSVDQLPNDQLPHDRLPSEQLPNEQLPSERPAQRLPAQRAAAGHVTGLVGGAGVTGSLQSLLGTVVIAVFVITFVVQGVPDSVSVNGEHSADRRLSAG